MPTLKSYMVILMLQLPQHHFLFEESAFTYSDYFEFQLTSESRISISGSSNVNEFTCLAYQDFSSGTGIIQKNEINNHFIFQHTNIKILVKSLGCDNSVMDYDMYQALKADSYPYITLTLKEAYASDNGIIQLSGNKQLVVIADLSIAGINKSQVIKITADETAGGQYSFKGNHTIRLKDFNIDAPTALFGVIKVKDQVTINFDLTVEVG